MIRIAMIGAGSIEFAQKLVQDFLCFESTRDAHFALVDIDGKRLETAHRVFKNMREQHGLGCTFSVGTDRRDALKGADLVITMISVGGNDALAQDIEIPLKYGVDQCVGDTLNPGGVFRGLRQVPPLLGLARDMSELCPDAMFLNYANPMAICSWAIQESFPEIQSVGLCHGVRHTTALLCRWLDVPVEACDTLTAGINHMAWYLKFTHHGEDLYPRIWEKLDREGPIEFEHYRFEIMKATGHFCTESPGHTSEYVPYFRHRKDLRALFDGHWLFGETAGYLREQIRTTERYEETDGGHGVRENAGSLRSRKEVPRVRGGDLERPSYRGAIPVCRQCVEPRLHHEPARRLLRGGAGVRGSSGASPLLRGAPPEGVRRTVQVQHLGPGTRCGSCSQRGLRGSLSRLPHGPGHRLGARSP